MEFATFTEQNTSLPIELIDQVLSHLSPRHLVYTALVCHSWAKLARRQLYRDVYIHTNRQYTRWLKTLDTACLEHRQHVRRILIHRQVHLDLDDLQLLRLCPWVESFDIGTRSTKNDYDSLQQLNINDIIGRRHRYPQLLHHWPHLKRLAGYHSDLPTAFLHSQLTGLVCSFEDLCTLSTGLDDPGQFSGLSYSGLVSLQPSYVLSALVDLHLTFGCWDMPVAILEMIHSVCPVLENLKLHVQSIQKTYGGTLLDTDGTMDIPPVSLKSLSLDGMVLFDPGCCNYLLHKYPHLSSLYLGFAFDEFLASPLLDQGGDDLCTNLQKNRSSLFDLISGYRRLTRLEIHLQGATEYVTSLWPKEEMVKWMNRGSNSGLGKAKLRTCGLQHLEMTYQRQPTQHSHDILGLDGMINSWVVQHQLQTLVLDVYNNDTNKNNGTHSSLIQTPQHNEQHSLQSTLDSFFYTDALLGTCLLRNMTTLCIKCFPGFDVSLTCLLDGLPGLRILDLAFGKFISRKRTQPPCSSYKLQQLILGSCTVTDSVVFMDLIQYHCHQLTTLNLENVVLDDGIGTAKPKTHVWDLSNRGLKHAWIKYLSFGSNGMVNWLKVHESTANRSTWYHTSMAQGTHGSSKPFQTSDCGLLYAKEKGCFENGGVSLELKCYFVEDILFC